MRVYVMPANQSVPCELREIGEDLSAMQEIVGGWIEIVRVRQLEEADRRVMGLSPHQHLMMVVNEEGALARWPDQPLPLNVRAMDFYPGPIHGDVFLVAESWTPDGPDLTSLPDDFRPVI